MKIALLHYTYAPLTGGVENILEQHAAVFAARGHEITVICSEGEGSEDNSSTRVVHIPEMRRDHPLTKGAQSELDAGKPGENFAELKNRIAAALTPMLQEMDVVFLHNVLTMHFHLALTVALWRITEKLAGVRFIAWTHDLSACNPDFSLPHLNRDPWNLLTKRNPHVEYIAISQQRKQQFLEITGSAEEKCTVIPNGIDAIAYLDLSPRVAKLTKEHRILEKEIVLLHPTRILRRKNIEFTLETTAAIKATGSRCLCMVTGAPDFFNSDVVRYHESLLKLRYKLGLMDEFLFLHELFPVTKRDLISLYHLADMLFYPSKQEGFGLPMLEGALQRLPIFCASVEPMKSLAHPGVSFFDLSTDPATVAESILQFATKSPAIQSRKQLMRDYSWEMLYPTRLEPLLAGRSHLL